MLAILIRKLFFLFGSCVEVENGQLIQMSQEAWVRASSQQLYHLIVTSKRYTVFPETKDSVLGNF